MQQQEKVRTLHIYLEEEDAPIVDAALLEELPRPRIPLLAVIYFAVVMLWGIGIPIVAILLGLAYPDTYDATITKTLTLTLSQNPGKGQLPLYALPPISIAQQSTVAATGSVHQDATAATGFITFYNGLFTPQTVPAGTTLTGKSGVAVVTRQTARIPAAIPTTPPTYGNISVKADSSVSGVEGNIAASDIDQACCGPSILAQNLDAFSGGQNAADLPELTKSDLKTGTQTLTAQVNAAVSAQAQEEAKPGDALLPLGCQNSLSASHQAGDEVANAVITLTEICVPLAYAPQDIEKVAYQRITVPKGYLLVSFAALAVGSHLTARGGTITVHVIAYLKQERPAASPYHVVGR